MEEMTATQKLIAEECDKVKGILLDKNRKYGDSAVHPKRVFSKADPIEQINVRLDDKVSRIMSGQCDDDEDPEFDLIGYLMLKRVAKRVHADSFVDVEAVELSTCDCGFVHCDLCSPNYAEETKLKPPAGSIAASLEKFGSTA
jgi:hypothetical protein